MFTLNFLLHLLPVCSIESLEGCFQSCISLWVVLTSIWITGRQVLDQKNSTTSDYPSQDSSHIPFETRGYSVAKDTPRHPTVLQYSNSRRKPLRRTLLWRQWLLPCGGGGGCRILGDTGITPTPISLWQLQPLILWFLLVISCYL